MRSTAAPLASALISILQANPALAGDGLLEINQTCAVETGCFAGDGPGFPVTIAASGTSYRLTSSLVVPNENTDAISFNFATVTNVSIDLGGFEVRGPVTCSGTPLVCTPASGTGSGIERLSSTNRALSVKNGSITGMGNMGAYLGDHATVSKVRVGGNRFVGMTVGNSSTISDSAAYQNGNAGMITGSASTVSRSQAYQNGSDGIAASSYSTVSGNTTALNEGRGNGCGSGCAVSGNSSSANGSDGFLTGAGSTVSDNAAYGNGGDGIQTTSGSTVHGNTVRSNAGFGLNLGAQSGYRENVISANIGGTVNSVAGLVNLGENACNGTSTCP